MDSDIDEVENDLQRFQSQDGESLQNLQDRYDLANSDEICSVIFKDRSNGSLVKLYHVGNELNCLFLKLLKIGSHKGYDGL
ncbi:hypothetical protein BGW38_004255 [Lunasporangiospora selenospora]|uniref:Uncharacterized protein n=1 Tax=Lunasporangiospora selenospora TaxID=979761 RepID=A0A9P6FQE2_9FUNG|nr:hypothetical protein BGW38_004255 [Lunasporangiospora selenospora]